MPIQNQQSEPREIIEVSILSNILKDLNQIAHAFNINRNKLAEYMIEKETKWLSDKINSNDVSYFEEYPIFLPKIKPQ